MRDPANYAMMSLVAVTLRRSLLVLAFLISPSLSRANHLNVYILTGQSNLLGTTEFERDTYAPGTHPADSQTHFFWSNVSSVGSKDPATVVLHGDSGGGIERLQMQQGNTSNPHFWGPEFGLARTLYDSGMKNVMVIKVGRSGGGNAYWRPTTGHMANHLVSQIDIALNAAEAAGHSFSVKGFLYLQGESNSESDASETEIRLQVLIDAVREHINCKFSGAAAEMYSVVGEIAASKSNRNRIRTTDAQIALARRSIKTGFVYSHDLPLKGDNLHFGRTAKLEIGRRFADALNSERWLESSARVMGYSANGGTAVISHPTAQGLAQEPDGELVTMDGINDAGTPAWHVLDKNVSLNARYHQSLVASDLRKMFEHGWVWTVKAKFVSGEAVALWSINRDIDPGWGIQDERHTNGFSWKRINDDELAVGLWGGSPPVNLGPSSANNYHTFEMRGAAESPLFNFYIDGELVSENVSLLAGPGRQGVGNCAFFGTMPDAGTAQEVYWNEVSLRMPSRISELVGDPNAD